jgi:hypothetical protein
MPTARLRAAGRRPAALLSLPQTPVGAAFRDGVWPRPCEEVATLPVATNVTLSDTVTLVTLQAQHKTVAYM